MFLSYIFSRLKIGIVNYNSLYILVYNLNKE